MLGDSSEIFPSKMVFVMLSVLLITSIRPLPSFCVNSQSDIKLFSLLKLSKIAEATNDVFPSNIVFLMVNVA